MKPVFEKVDYEEGKSAFKIYQYSQPYFSAPWHFHPEYELTYIISGRGKRYVGDSMESFEEGDLVFLPSNLPHVWISKKSYHTGNKNLKCKCIVLQINPLYVQDHLFKYTDLGRIGDFFRISQKGFFITGETSKKIKQLLACSISRETTERYLNIMQILYVLSKQNDIHPLASHVFLENNYLNQSHKLQVIYKYVNDNYNKNISLEQAAEKANMNKSSFCRYFMEKTNKTFMEYVNFQRIRYACMLLIEEKFSIGEICYESGFNNLSHFNRQFRKQTGKTPGQYRNQFSGLPGKKTFRLA